MSAVCARLNEIQLLSYLALTLALLFSEYLTPWFPRSPQPWRHARVNFSLTALNALTTLAIGTTMAAVSAAAATRHVGIFNALRLSGGAGLLAALLVLDLSNYALHRLKHAVPALWR